MLNAERKPVSAPGTARLGILLLVAALHLACGKDTAGGFETTEPDASTPDAAAPDAEVTQPDMGSDDVSIGQPDVSFPAPAVRVDTTVATAVVKAGDIVGVTCRLYDADDNEVIPPEPPTYTVAVAPESSFERQGSDWMAVRVGQGMVRCGAPDLGLVDEEPAAVEIVAGDPHSSTITLDKSQMVAGETATATCEVFDAFGNRIDDAVPNLMITPSGGGIDVAGYSATITVADVYTATCFLPGLATEQAAYLEVIPDLPAQLVVAVNPNQQVFGLGQVVGVTWVVTDQYGNEIPNATVSTTSDLPNQEFGVGRYRYDQEGTYQITVTVDGPTEDGDPLQETVTVVVNGVGPAIQCDDPLDGSMLNASPGSMVAFGGTVSDANGVQSVTVNGSGVTIAADGSFSSDVTVGFGMNFVEIVAIDQYGEENSRSCVFLAADNWHSPNTYMDDSVILKLLQAAIDDSNPSDLDSLNDLLYAVINSQGLVNEVDAALRAANPLQPSTCVQQSCTIFGCICWFGYGVTYLDLAVSGPNTTSLTLVPNGIRATAHIEDIGMRVRVPYTVTGIDGSTTGWVYLSSVDVGMILDVSLVNNQPRATVRANSVTVNVGGVSTNFSGLDGFIVDLVVVLFEGMVRDLVADTLRGFVEDSVDEVLDGVLSSLDVNTLGTTFSIPRLDAAGTVDVRFNLRFSRLSALSSRLAMGIGTRFTPVVVNNGRPSLGVPLPPGNAWNEPATTRPVLVGVYMGILNHVLHAVWRGGLFDATITGATLGGGLPADVSATIEADLPPVVENLSNGKVKLMLGGLRVALTYPGIFDDPLQVSLGAVATSSVALAGDDLQFGAITIDELYFSTGAVSLDATTRSVLEGFLQRLVQSFVDSALNQSLPALPIPTFQIPQSLSTYGLPGGAELGIVNPTLTTTDRQYILEGTFGVR